MMYIPVSKRNPKQMKHAPDENENPQKYYDMFQRRASMGQTFNQPYLGCREFSAGFKLISHGEISTPPLAEDRDLGIMLYDMDYSDPKNIMPIFYRPEMKQGVIIVPPIDSNDLLR